MGKHYSLSVTLYFCLGTEVPRLSAGARTYVLKSTARKTTWMIAVAIIEGGGARQQRKNHQGRETSLLTGRAGRLTLKVGN